MTNDIIARLRMSGEAFTQDTKSIFSTFNQDAITSTGQAKAAFDTSFSDIQAIVRKSLTMPKLDTGSLDLGVTQYQAAAVAAQNEAIALREVATAARAAATATDDTSAATRLYLAAAEAAAVEAETNAAAATTQATSMQRLQAQMGLSRAETISHSDANDKLSGSSGRASVSMQIMQHVLRSTGDALAAGAPLSMVFGTQIGRVGEAAEMAAANNGGLGKFAGFLTGGWGIALQVGVTALSILIPKLLDTSDAADDAAKKGLEAFRAKQEELAQYIDTTNGKLNVQLRLQAQLAQQANPAAVSDALQPGVTAVSGAFKAARSTLTGLGSGRAGPSGDALLLSRAIADANGNVQLLNQNLAGIPSGNKAIDDLKASVVTFASTAADAAHKAQGITAAGAALAVVNRGGVVDSAALEQQRVAEATATTRVEKAQLALNEAKKAGEDIDKQNYSPAQQTALKANGDLQIRLTNELKAAQAAAKHTRQPNDHSGLINTATNDAANFTAQFTDSPTFIDKADAALRKLSDDAAALGKLKPTDKIEETLAKIAAAKDVIENNLDKPYQDFVKQQDRSLSIQQLQLAGRDAEARALQNAYTLIDKQKTLSAVQLQGVYQRADQEERIARALEDQQRLVNIYTSSVGNLQQTFDQFLDTLSTKPGKALSGLVSGAVTDFRKLQQDLLSNAIFGGVDRDIADYVKGKNNAADPTAQLKVHADQLGSDFDDLGARVRAASLAMAGSFPANDNVGVGGTLPAFTGFSAGDLSAALSASIPDFAGKADDADPANNEIVVTAKKQAASMDANTTALLKSTTIFDRIGQDVSGNLSKLGITLPKAVSDHLGSVLQGASIGGTAGGVFASITGGKQNGTTSAIGGALGEVAGKALTKGVSGILGKLGGPLGAIAGGILGNVLGGLFSKSPGGGGATITSATGAATTSGNSAFSANAVSLTQNVQQSISSIASALGAKVGTFAPVTIGQYGKNGEYRVNTTGGTVLGGSSSAISGVDYFGTGDAGAAAATADAIKIEIEKGVITGISQASQNILKSGQDLQTAITKAASIEQIPKDLKAITDPVGAAIDTLNAKWDDTYAALKEGGATVEQMTQAQQLYNLQLADVKANTDSASKGLKDFLQSLKVGTASPLSLRDQESAAQTALQPYLDSIASGQTINQTAYQSAAQSFLDIERQLYGSTDAYFAQFDKIQAATNQAISTIDNATPIASTATDPFASATATATQATATSTQTTAEILAQQTDLLTSQGTTLAQILAALQASGSAFASGAVARAFAA